MPMMLLVAEMERDLLVERTQAGLARAKAEGKTLGRPSKTMPARVPRFGSSWGRVNLSAALARVYGVSRANIIGIREAREN